MLDKNNLLTTYVEKYKDQLRLTSAHKSYEHFQLLRRRHLGLSLSAVIDKHKSEWAVQIFTRKSLDNIPPETSKFISYIHAVIIENQEGDRVFIDYGNGSQIIIKGDQFDETTFKKSNVLKELVNKEIVEHFQNHEFHKEYVCDADNYMNLVYAATIDFSKEKNAVPDYTFQAFKTQKLMYSYHSGTRLAVLPLPKGMQYELSVCDVKCYTILDNSVLEFEKKTQPKSSPGFFGPGNSTPKSIEPQTDKQVIDNKESLGQIIP